MLDCGVALIYVTILGNIIVAIVLFYVDELAIIIVVTSCVIALADFNCLCHVATFPTLRILTSATVVLMHYHLVALHITLYIEPF